MRYKIRYLTLDSNLIFNYCGPMSGLHMNTIERQLRGVKQKIEIRAAIDNFYERLEENILQNGFLDPIVVNAGFVKDPVWRRHPNDQRALPIKEILSCYKLGGSRLWIAHKHNLSVPCIVNDFVDRFSDAEELKTEEDIMAKFINKPDSMTFDPDGLYIIPKLVGEWRKNGHA